MLKMAMALTGISVPEKISLTGDSEVAWKSFKQKFEFYVLGTGQKDKEDEEKIGLLLTLGGDDLLEVYNGLEFAAGDEKKLKKVLEKFDRYFAPRKNELAARYKFRKCEQKPGEPIEAFITRLKILVKDCNFEQQKDKMIRDQIVFCCNSDDLREKFFKEEDLTLDRVKALCLSYQAQKSQMDTYRGENETTIHKVTSKPKKIAVKYPEKSQPDKPDWMKKCRFCDLKHLWKKEKCPAYGKTCENCGKKNHFKIKCPMNHSEKRVNAIHECDDSQESESEVEYVLKVSNNSLGSRDIMAQMEIEGKVVSFQVDCGATTNVIPRSLVPDKELSPSHTPLHMWNNTTIVPIGKCRVMLRNCKNKKKYSVEFTVVEENLTPLLSKKASEQMKLITVNYENICTVKNDVLMRYEEVFSDGVGNLPGVVHLTIDETVAPVAVPSCRIPISMKRKVEEKLGEMVAEGIIEKVDEPTDWVSRMVAGLKKNGDVRICIDPQALNKALKREMFPLLVIEDILPEISKARVFTKLDLKCGYWHCSLDAESSKLTTFQTPFGRYKWKRLPFGLAVSSEIFQKRLQAALEGLDGVLCVADDILVFGVGDDDKMAERDHNLKLDKLLERCAGMGIRLNKDKVALRKTEITFLGHKITKDGLMADPEKVQSIIDLTPPTNVTEVQQLSGMINYLSKFLPGLSDVMKPIRMLTLKDTEWKWGNAQKSAFQKIKELVTEAPVLGYYDQRKPLVLQCDASQTGLGACLMQEKRPLCYASRALTPTEGRYAQIEKEMLAVVFGLSKFHHYTFGRTTHVVSDHKPLESIIKKSLDAAPKRLQGMLMKVQKYNIKLEYCPGKEMYIADYLSRAHKEDNEGGDDFDSINMVKLLPIRQEKIDRIREATQRDETTKMLEEYVVSGWPNHREEVPVLIRAYFHIRDEISIQDGVLFKGERVIIPQALRGEMKMAIHACHSGIEGCLRRARECIYWPGMNAELREYIAACDVCNEMSKAQQKETLMPHELASRPWEKIGIDLMELNGQNYLITVDYFSNYWEVDQLPSTKSKSVIMKLQAHFARYGLPCVVISDNGPQFHCEEFESFASEWGFEHRTSSPGHPKSNGLAESAVKTAKHLITKAVRSGRDPNLALLEYRNTPTAGLDSSPVQRMFGRRTRTLLPTTPNMLEPHGIDASTVRQKMKAKQIKSADYYNQNAKDLDALEEGEVVRMKPFVLGKKKWDKGVVTKRLDERSYEIMTDAGILRRNRVYLRKSGEHGVSEDKAEINGRNDGTEEKLPILPATPIKPVVPTTPAKPVEESEIGNGKVARKSRGQMPARFKDFVLK